MKVIAKCSFEHNGTRKAGDEFEVTDQAARLLVTKGLVDLSEKAEGGQESSQSGANGGAGDSVAANVKPARKRTGRQG